MYEMFYKHYVTTKWEENEMMSQSLSNITMI